MKYIESLSRKSVLILSLIVLVIVGAIDSATGVELSFSILYLLPIALVTWYIGRWAGVTMSIVCAMVWYLSDLLSSPSYSSPIVPYWNATVMLGFFLTTALVLSTLRRTIDRDNSLAREIQVRLLPAEMPIVPGYEIAGAWRPAHSVGGDYYDVIPVNGKSLVLCVADVVGHGMPAALLMSNLQAAVRMLVLSKTSPRDVCAQLNTLIAGNSTSDKFISIFYSVLDVETQEITYTNAGHPPPVIIRNNGETVSLGEGGIPIGMLPGYSYDQGRTRLGTEDLLAIYTDGVTEVSNARGEQFGEKRVLDILKENHRRGANASCNAVIDAVSEFSNGNYLDDIALLVVTSSGIDGAKQAVHATSPTERIETSEGEQTFSELSTKGR